MSVIDLPTDLYDTAPPATDAGLGAGAVKARLTSAATAMLLPVLRRVSNDSIGAETLDDAWRVALRIEAEGLSHTLGFWDTPAYSMREVADIYLAAIERAAGTTSYISIKPPALRFDAGAARELASVAAQAKVRLHCDSHGLNVADLTFDFADALLRDLSPHLVSVTLPGRWARSLTDADRLLSQGAGVRVVKGQWPDPSDAKRELAVGFLEVVERCAGQKGHVAIASRDLPLLEVSIARLKAAGAPFEVEFIHGSQSPLLVALAARSGAPARIYVPFGRGFVPSALGVLRRNPALALGIMKQMVRPRRG